MMSRRYDIIAKSIIALAVLTFSAIAYHSIEEIHYLKSFLPQTYTVEQAFYACGIELIKIIIIAIPVFLVIVICIILIRQQGQINKDNK